MTVIYIDMLLALNLVIDYLLLCGCARVLQLPVHRGRMITGATVGALASLMILLPPMNAVLSLLCKLGTALLMVPIAFPVRSVTRFCKASVTLFVISALFAGVCSGLYLLLSPAGVLVQSGIVYMPIPPLLLLALTTVSYGVLCLYDRFTRRRMVRDAAFRIEIIHKNERVVLHALFDSGHSLRDSFSGAPVIVAKRSALGALRTQAEPALASLPASSPIRYIPFSSLGGGGVLPSFRPTQIILHTADKAITLDNAWVAVTEHLGKGDCEALIGPDIANDIFTTGRCIK